MKDKNEQDTLEALAKSRIFIGNLALSVSRRHGQIAAKKFTDACQAIDESIRALRESEIITEVSQAQSAALDLSAYQPLELSKSVH